MTERTTTAMVIMMMMTTTKMMMMLMMTMMMIDNFEEMDKVVPEYSVWWLLTKCDISVLDIYFDPLVTFGTFVIKKKKKPFNFPL